MTIAEISVSTSTVAPLQSANALTAAQPRQQALQFGGFRLTYDPQNRELFLVYTSPESGLVMDQIPGFQTVTSRRNSTPAAPVNLPSQSSGGGSTSGGGAAPAPAAASAPGPGAAAAAAIAAASTPVSRGGAVNIAS